jgi:hypothetical protein
MARKDSQQFEKSGVEKPIRTGAKQVKKPMLHEMSDKTASEAGRWSPRSGSNWSAPDTSRSVYAPPRPERTTGQATMSDNRWAVDWLKSDTSNTRRKPDLFR